MQKNVTHDFRYDPSIFFFELDPYSRFPPNLVEVKIFRLYSLNFLFCLCANRCRVCTHFTADQISLNQSHWWSQFAIDCAWYYTHECTVKSHDVSTERQSVCYFTGCITCSTMLQQIVNVSTARYDLNSYIQFCLISGSVAKWICQLPPSTTTVCRILHCGNMFKPSLVIFKPKVSNM